MFERISDSEKIIIPDQALVILIAEAFETNDIAFISQTLDIIVREKGIAGRASHEEPYTLETTLSILKALNVRLAVRVNARPYENSRGE
jgi:DNA-binding phage protein